MQTFLPYSDFVHTGMILDKLRLDNQIWNESPIIFNALIILKHSPVNVAFAWSAHPAVRMWQEHRNAFCMYNSALARAGLERYPNQPVYEKWFKYWQNKIDDNDHFEMPAWLGYEKIHQSHRANLIHERKHAVTWYSNFFKETPRIGYDWPVRYVGKKFIFLHPEQWVKKESWLPDVWKSNMDPMVWQRQMQGEW